MLANPFLRIILNDKLEIIPEELSNLLPSDVHETQQRRQLMELLAQTKLDEVFVEKYFEELPLDTLLDSNELSEEFIRNKFERIQKEIFHDVIYHSDVDVFSAFLSKNYSSDIYERLLNTFFELFKTKELPATVIEVFNDVINAFSETVSKQFIYDHVHQSTSQGAGYYYLPAALNRDDFTFDELVEWTHIMEYEEITVLLEHFSDDDDTEEGREKIATLRRLLVAKANNEIERDENTSL